MKINSIHIYTMYNTFIIVGETIFFFTPSQNFELMTAEFTTVQDLLISQ